MLNFDNPNGASLAMEIPLHTALGGPARLFGNHPVKDRPAGM